jgi:dihydrolipoamide dehydrogenase
VFCESQVASFGFTEGRARADGIPFQKAMFPFRAVGKAVASGKPEGQVKVLVDPRTHEILGAHVVGEGAPELLLARSAELLPEDIATLIHAHPTLSEAVMEAMRAVEGRAIHF